MWKVDLIDKYEVNSVVIHNRVDCCSERINGVQVCDYVAVFKFSRSGLIFNFIVSSNFNHYRL